jgi:hypothetical protein
MKHRDLTGRRFGRLEAIEFMGLNHHASAWKCRCSCGTTVIVRADHMLSGATTSCGCFRREANTTHGMKGTREWRIWKGMRSRCSNPSETSFKYYGGRGIVVCNRWERSFESFFQDMGNCPKGLEIDRIDNDGDYEPDNCRWVDHKTNCNNKSHHT